MARFVPAFSSASGPSRIRLTEVFFLSSYVPSSCCGNGAAVVAFPAGMRFSHRWLRCLQCVRLRGTCQTFFGTAYKIV
ncbi:hypothetical protein GBB04_04405 [Bifidobacterium dentium]|uniref:Uncharacterized protein n=1 Tax=Bifidobacterium dentium TaxID=1689 RepID=A0A7J5TJM2_9BIFI|nr:hypothetical protein GBA94_06165 [Bifidobacterium dentium]KAB7461703.1 hypothetical protein GBB04_04405 [Bifidobacterium dentium]KAB7463782.1 hypothetical protein GBB12_08280 [Bifidobacterium dentium]